MKGDSMANGTERKASAAVPAKPLSVTMARRQRTRRALLLAALLLFPVTLNYMSPYISIDGAMAGVASGSLLLFGAQFLSALVLGRAWCGWLCPVGGLSETARSVNDRPVKRRPLAVSRYAVFSVWAAAVVLGFVLAGGVRGVDPFRLTERYLSVDEPVKYITYYLVLALMAGLTLGLGRRGACHAVCWMAPFMTAGHRVGRLLGLPQLRIRSATERCTDCGTCDRKCPMSLPVNALQREGTVRSSDCILCGECVDGCPQRTLRYGFERRR